MAFFLPFMTGKKYISFVLLITVMVITVVVYWPGLHSGFYLDDYPNLAGLAQITEQGVLSYILGGVSSPLGRPLSLATFAIQFQAWPDNPFVFKLANLVIHLLNGCLVFMACRLLLSFFRPAPDSKRAGYFAFIVTAFWLLHPVQQDTVLYTVQRMNELSAFFSLCGYVFYLHCRKYIQDAGSLRHYLLVGGGIWLFMILAIFSKENGILLPLLILVTEFTLLRISPRSHGWYAWSIIFLATPLFLLAIYLFSGMGDVLHSYRFRDYSAGDRLLTQGGVLLVYLKNLLLPNLSAFSIFTDDYPVADGLLSPFYILPAVIIVIFLILLAITQRKTLPVFSFGILWFMAGHSLEASHLNLEMYFDHRNYLPSFGIFFLLIWMLFLLYEKHRTLIITGGSLYFLFLASITFANTSLWGRPGQFLELAASNHPQSIRARTYLLNHYIKSREIGRAKRELSVISDFFPGEIFPRLKEIAITACLEQEIISDNRWQVLNDMAKNGKDSDFDNISVLNNIAFLATNGYCDSLDKRKMVNVVVTLAQNDDYVLRRSSLYEIAASLEAGLGDKDRVVQYIKQAGRYGNSVPNKISQIEVLLSMNRHDDAEALLYALKDYLDRHKRLELAWKGKVSELEQRLNKK